MFYPFADQSAQYCQLIRDCHREVLLNTGKVKLLNFEDGVKYLEKLKQHPIKSAHYRDGAYHAELIFSDYYKMKELGWVTKVCVVNNVVGFETDVKLDVEKYSFKCIYLKYPLTDDLQKLKENQFSFIFAVVANKNP